MHPPPGDPERNGRIPTALPRPELEPSAGERGETKGPLWSVLVVGPNRDELRGAVKGYDKIESEESGL